MEGGNASPFIYLADLFLSQLEYNYMMDTNTPNNLKHVLSNNKRYLDDILVLNCKKFIDISKNIYPSELTLEPSHGAGLEDHFLHLNINISGNNKLSFKMYNKTDDFESKSSVLPVHGLFFKVDFVWLCCLTYVNVWMSRVKASFKCWFTLITNS